MPDDFLLNTNPYCSEYKFLTRIGVRPDEVLPIDVGPSAIEFMNYAFSNQFDVYGDGADIQHCHRIDCARESEEAIVVAEITARAVAKNKTVLVITPDAAGNQRIGAALASRGVVADFSGGISGAMTRPGRVVDKQVLAEAVWGDHADQSDNFSFLYQQVANLKRKLKEAGASVAIQAVYGFGYKLVEEGERS